MRVDQIRYLCAHLRATISQLDARILVLENSLAAARCEREKLQSRLADYKYPVLTLPAEITSEIFTHFLSIYPMCSPITRLLHLCSWDRYAANGAISHWVLLDCGAPSRSKCILISQISSLHEWIFSKPGLHDPKPVHYLYPYRLA
jgi:hypothetical protein